MTDRLKRIRSFVVFALLALVLVGGAGMVWGALLLVNLRTTPAVPWALPALLAFLWAFWRYLGGRGWPARTSAARRRLLRAHPVDRRTYLWSAAAGFFALSALAGLWIVMFRLVPMQPNPLVPGRFAGSTPFALAILIGASVLAPVVEESAVRGYLQGTLEDLFSPATAVILSSIVFAMAHVTQGLAWSKLTFYFLVGVTFGTLAYRSRSILPVMPVHMAGDVLFFTCIWPFDAGRVAIAQSGTDLWFWIHVGQTIVCGAFSVIVLLRAPGRPGEGRQPRFTSP